MPKPAIIAIAVLVVLGAGALVFYKSPSPPEPVFCAQDAKLCPDGSYVGRVGPKCEFTRCPSGGPVSLEARIGEEAMGLGVRVIPLEVLEDSRCPVDVVCIWAGTVRVRARLISGLGEALQEFILGESITTEAERVTLTEVYPPPKAGVKIKSSEYVFRFEIAKRDATGAQNKSGIRGTALLGPTCPVERIPPDPACAPKLYQTKLVATTPDGARVIKEFSSDAKGTFSVDLLPGDYAIRSAVAANVWPYCSSETITVKANAYASATVHCDTGIR